MVESNTVDIGVVESPIANKSLAVEVCWQDQLVFICRPDHPMAGAKSVPVRDLLELPFLAREEGSGTARSSATIYAQTTCNGMNLNLSMEFGSPESVKSSVEGGLGVSIVSKATVAKELKLGTLVALPLDPPIERPFSFVYQRQKFRLRAVEEFMQFMRKHCDEQQGRLDEASSGALFI